MDGGTGDMANSDHPRAEDRTTRDDRDGQEVIVDRGVELRDSAKTGPGCSLGGLTVEVEW